MAQRTIESPGVEINEVDLSLRTVTPVGTKVLTHGYAAQGPTNELILVSTKDELDQLFFGGAGPTNAAERYFHGSCREILNSPATLMVTRLPYGSGDGTGFDGEYTALAYPATGKQVLTVTNSAAPPELLAATTDTTFIESINRTFVAGEGIQPNSLTLTINRQVSADVGGTSSLNLSASVTILENGLGVLFDSITNPVVSGWVNYTTGEVELSGWLDNAFSGVGSAVLSSQLVASYDYLSTGAGLLGDSNYLEMDDPYVVPITESQYEDIKSGQITWETTGGVCDSFDTLGNAAMLVINDAKTTIDEGYEGYYLAVVDNSSISNSDFNAITEVKTLNSANSLTNLSESLLGFPLTGSNTANGGNISEVIETGYNYDLTDSSYNDSLIMYIFRLRTSVYAADPDKLYFIPVEKYLGSMESDDQRASPVNGQMDSFYLPDKINNQSNYIQMFVNKNISEVASLDYVRNVASTLNPVGSYTPCKADTVLKHIGNVPNKIERALALAESVQAMDIDITLGAGLETVWSYVADSNGADVFDDTSNVSVKLSELADVNLGASSDYAGYHKTIFNLYNNFCSNTRKDCVHLSDPTRGIFIQGEKAKTLDRKDRNFTQHILNPLKNLYNSANSNYAATYANWVSFYDNNLGKFTWMPFSGWQAAIMARMDARLQPWYAPFGLNNGIIPNIVDIAFRSNQKQQDAMYRHGINPVVFFQGDGFVVWGQKTLQAKPSAFDRLNVRRLFLVLERGTLKIMRYFVGEPNTIFTRTRVSNVLKPLFDLAVNNEGAYDYIIVCDERNNTPTVIDNNEMKVDIYIKPVRTAEFILVTFFATRTDQDFSELTG